MTDEQLVSLLDAASQRITERALSHFDEMVEAVRAGFIFAHDSQAAARWRSRRQRESQPQRAGGLSGAALERAVWAIAARDPSLVAVIG